MIDSVLSNKSEERKKRIAEAVEQLGGETFAPLVVFHFLEIGARTAENLTAEDIAEEVRKQEQEEAQARARGMVCLISADYVRYLLEKVATLAKMSAPVRTAIIKKYL